MVVISHHPSENLASSSKLNQCTVVLVVQLHSSGNILLHQHWTHGDNNPSLLPRLYFIYMLEQIKLHANLPSLHVTRENVMLYGCKETSVLSLPLYTINTVDSSFGCLAPHTVCSYWVNTGLTGSILIKAHDTGY